MKIRSDFVTNSSSYSSVCISIESKEITEIMSKYQQQPFEMAIGEKSISIWNDEMADPWSNVPESINDFMDSFLDALKEVEADPSMIRELESRKKELTDTIQGVDWQYNDDSYDEFETDDDCEKTFNYKKGGIKKKWPTPKADDCVIKNGVLKKYNGKGGHVIIPLGVTEIGSKAFSGCESLTEVTIPESVTLIRDNSFENCTNLKSITIPGNVSSFGEYVFFDCSSLTEVIMEEGVEGFGVGAFCGCNNISKIVIPASMEFIMPSSFDDMDVTIYAPEGSAAEEYAEEEGIPFVAI